jgi:hypothetical protein
MARLYLLYLQLILPIYCIIAFEYTFIVFINLTVWSSRLAGTCSAKYYQPAPFPPATQFEGSNHHFIFPSP